MTGRGSPWQNRPSLIACWEHEATAVDTSGLAIAAQFFAMDGLSVGQIPVCIPRACRLTRCCLIYAYDAFGLPAVNFNLIFEKSIDCGTTFPVSESLSVPQGTPGFQTNCFCSDLDELSFDECDVWRAYFDATSADGIFIPLMRLVVHFELR